MEIIYKSNQTTNQSRLWFWIDSILIKREEQALFLTSDKVSKEQSASAYFQEVRLENVSRKYASIIGLKLLSYTLYKHHILVNFMPSLENSMSVSTW